MADRDNIEQATGAVEQNPEEDRDIRKRFPQLKEVNFICTDRPSVRVDILYAAHIPLVVDSVLAFQQKNDYVPQLIHIEVPYSREHVVNITNYVTVQNGGNIGPLRFQQYNEQVFAEPFYRQTDISKTISALPVVVYFGLEKLADLIALEIAQVFNELPWSRFAMAMGVDNNLSQEEIEQLEGEETGLEM
ncbi:hypothetical protein TYRP_023217 [Tyrophagus putrescentiae]|nr:hypothetical protein TYRP_023217 [Tyrophagus putrescentiae]